MKNGTLIARLSNACSGETDLSQSKYHKNKKRAKNNLRPSLQITFTIYKCILAFLASSSSTVSTYISSGTQQSTGHTAAHCGSS